MMDRKYPEVAERLRRYMTARKQTVEEFCEEWDLSANSLRNGYLSGRSLPGGELLRKLILAGVDVRWLLTGHGGIPPNPTEEEARAYVKHLKEHLQYWERWLQMWEDAKHELAEKLREEFEDHEEKPYRNAAEPKQSYTSKRGKKK